MRLEEISRRSLSQASSKELRSLRFRMIQLWNRNFKKNPDAIVGGLDRSCFLEKYRLILREMAARGIRINPIYHIDRFVKILPELVLVPEFASLTGSYVYGKEKPGDMDVVVRTDSDLKVDLSDALRIKLTRILSDGKLAVHLIPCETGPNCTYLPVYDLVLRPSSGQIRRVDSFEKSFKWFRPPKPVRAAAPEKRMTLDFLAELIRDRYPVLVSKKYDGMRCLVMKNGKWAFYSDDGSKLDIDPKPFSNIKADEFILDCEITMWKGGKHMPREAVTAAIHRGETDVAFNVFDIVYLNKPLFDVPQGERLAILKKLIPNASLMVKAGLNRVPHFLARNESELLDISKRLCEAPGSEGVVVKFPDAGYFDKEAWIKYHKNAILYGVVLEAIETKAPGVYNYRYGVRPGKMKVRRSDLVEVNGELILECGKTFSTSKRLRRGDYLCVEFETLNLIKRNDEIEISAWVPRFIGEADHVDDLDTVIKRARDNGVLQIKEIDESGNVVYKADPYLMYPKDGKFVFQLHARGSSVHGDLRLQISDDELKGYTLMVQNPGVPKVDSVEELKKLAKNPKYWKIDFNTGEFKRRVTRAGHEVDVSIRAIPKTIHDISWLKVEGVAKPGEVGATKNEKGVFAIIDKGEYDTGALKPYFHEYFMYGKIFKGRYVFRLVSRKSLLPPGVEEERPLTPFYWVLIKPKDQLPYVLSKRAIELKWLPPRGVSALPRDFDVPKDLRYWEMPREKALEARKALAESLKKSKAHFKLFELRFKGQQVIRFGPSAVVYPLLIDDEKEKPQRWDLNKNPLDAKSLVCYYYGREGSQWLKLEGNNRIEPGEYGNPSKDTPCELELIDQGPITVYEDRDSWKRWKFQGKKLKAFVNVFRESEGLWNWEETEKAPTFFRKNAPKQIVSGVVYSPYVVDAHGDITTPEVIEEAMEEFMKNGPRFNINHEGEDIEAVIIENWITRTSFMCNGIFVPEGSWCMSVHIPDKKHWRMVEEGKLNGFSLEGFLVRDDVSVDS